MGFWEAIEHLGDDAWLEEADHRGHVLESYVLYLVLSPFIFLSPGYHETSSIALPPNTSHNVLLNPRPRNNGSKSQRLDSFFFQVGFLNQPGSHCIGTQTTNGFLRSLKMKLPWGQLHEGEGLAPKYSLDLPSRQTRHSVAREMTEEIRALGLQNEDLSLNS